MGAVQGASVKALKEEEDASLFVITPSIKEFHRHMRLHPVDIIVLSGRTDYFPEGVSYYQSVAKAILTCPDYGIESRSQDTVILKHGADFKAGLRYLGVRLYPGETEKQVDKAVAATWNDLVGKYQPQW